MINLASPWTLAFLGVLFIILCVFFYWPWLFGAPFEPTDKKRLKQMLKLASPKKKDKVVDLGSGDGRFVVELAKKFSVEAHGYEINPFLVLISRWKIKREGLKGRAYVHWKSFWKVNLRKYDVVVLFQFPTIMKRLEKKLDKELKKGTKIVSRHWKFPSWKPIKRINDIYLYKMKGTPLSQTPKKGKTI